MDGVLELWAVRDPAGLDERRAALGLEPEAENRARLLAARGPADVRMTSRPATVSMTTQLTAESGRCA